jgi:hypothetical protein
MASADVRVGRHENQLMLNCRTVFMAVQRDDLWCNKWESSKFMPLMYAATKELLCTQELLSNSVELATLVGWLDARILSAKLVPPKRINCMEDEQKIWDRVTCALACPDPACEERKLAYVKAIVPGEVVQATIQAPPSVVQMHAFQAMRADNKRLREDNEELREENNKLRHALALGALVELAESDDCVEVDCVEVTSD